MNLPPVQALSYDIRLEKAAEWWLENSDEKYVVTARIFNVKADSLRQRLQRTQAPARAMRGSGGRNRILTKEQSIAIVQYCEDCVKYGYGATREMIMAAITHLRQEEKKSPPSSRWFSQYLKGNPDLHVIKQTVHERERIQIHDVDTVERWFVRLRDTMDEKKIITPRQIWNFDEMGLMVGTAKGESVVVPTYIKEVHTPTPMNRKSLTLIEAVCADGRPPIPPGVILPGRVFMKNWFHEGLKGAEVLILSDTGFTNEQISCWWLDHFIKHTDSGSNKS